MSEQRFFVTGALGCLGAWVVRNLIQEGVSTTVYDLGGSQHRLKLIMSDDELAQVRFISGDVTDLSAVETALRDSAATHIIHLAALQVPFCKADPALGSRVNVVGTVNMFEAAKRVGLKRIVYASSIAVYGSRSEYPDGLVKHDAPANPLNHYGVYKRANEGTAKIYWLDDGISSIGLRPYTIYGPGRDQGLTSTPTKAMLAAAAGQSYHITYGGYNGFQYTDDVAKIFIQAARASAEGTGVYNLRGSIAHVSEVVDAIHAVVPDVGITFEQKPLALPDGFEDVELVKAIGPVPEIPLAEGVASTIYHFRQALAEGKITAENL